MLNTNLLLGVRRRKFNSRKYIIESEEEEEEEVLLNQLAKVEEREKKSECI